MATATEILTAMKQSAADGVSSTSFSAGSSSQSEMSIGERLQLYRFLREEEAKGLNHGGIRMLEIQPPGARND